MTENEIKLIELVRTHKHPIRATMIAINIITFYLMRRESSPKPSSADLRERA